MRSNHRFGLTPVISRSIARWPDARHLRRPALVVAASDYFRRGRISWCPFIINIAVLAMFCAGLYAQNTAPKNRGVDDREPKQAALLIDSLRSKLPSDDPKRLAEALVIYRELTEYLRGWGPEGSFPFLVKHTDPAVRREAALLLAELSRTSDHASKTIERLTYMLNDRDIEVRCAAYLGLARMAPLGKSAVPMALEGLKHDDPRIRRRAYLVVSHWYPFDKEMLTHVIAALDDPDVGPWKDRPAVGSVSWLALDSLCRDDLVERAREGAKAAIPKLEKFIESKKSWESHAVAALARIAPDNKLVLSLAREQLKKEESISIQNGARLVGLIGEHAREIIPDLIEAARRKPDLNAIEEQNIKIAIAHAFQKLGTLAIDALPVLESLSGTEDLTVRREVLLAIDAVTGKKK